MKKEYEQQLKEQIMQIHCIDYEKMERVKKRWDQLCKPLKSLGKLEQIVIQLSGITRSENPCSRKKAVVIMAADHGVVEEGVTQTGQGVTRSVVESMTKGGSAVCIMAKQNGADVFPVDLGIATDPIPFQLEGKEENPIIRKKIRYGTGNIKKEIAMTREEAARAILAGIDVIKELSHKGYDTFAVGEMGIGNTTISSAICSAYFNCDVEDVTGRGAGLSSEGFKKKQKVIKEALQLHKPDSSDPLDLLFKVGGLELAGMVGCYLGGAIEQKPVIMDGFISSVAALLATLLESKVKDYLLPSHCSKEPAGQRLLAELQMEPYLQMDMCMGEGTGAVLVFPLIDTALACYKQIPMFEENKIEPYVPLI